MITEQILTGAAIAGCLEAIATLRLDIFREYPYLYNGRRQGELEYLAGYAVQTDARAILARDGGNVVGAATGIPLAREGEQMVAPFSDTVYPVEELYYVGELLLYPAYRNRGMGAELLASLEQQVRTMGIYRWLTCATVERPVDHPLRTPDYVPITRFLARTGFVILPGVTTSFAWEETDGARREHTMQFWLKEL